MKKKHIHYNLKHDITIGTTVIRERKRNFFKENQGYLVIAGATSFFAIGGAIFSAAALLVSSIIYRASNNELNLYAKSKNYGDMSKKLRDNKAYNFLMGLSAATVVAITANFCTEMLSAKSAADDILLNNKTSARVENSLGNWFTGWGEKITNIDTASLYCQSESGDMKILALGDTGALAVYRRTSDNAAKRSWTGTGRPRASDMAACAPAPQ